jgi:hypothetical protein
VHESGSRLQALLGLQPEIGSLDDTDLPTLQKSVGESLQRWSAAAMVPPVAAVAAPGLAVAAAGR